MTHRHLNLNEPVGDAVKTTTCYMCACRCGVKVHLKDNRIRHIQGNPDHPVNRGVICAKGAAGIMQHESPARLRAPMKRVGPRGSGEFVEIGWDEALATAAGWLGAIRATDPDQLAFFTGRDQSQALTGWWAQQFGTVNYAAHGGFCSVNMAAAGMYTLGSAFWEFGEPDFEHAKYLMLWGVAEDHDSNPLKLGLGRLKARGAKIVAINPVRTGYAAIADEWVPIRPGTDGLLVGALVHELLRAQRIDARYLVRYTNAHWLVIDAPGTAQDGLVARDGEGHAWCRTRDGVAPADAVGIAPLLAGSRSLPDGRRAVPAFQRFAERFLAPEYSPAAVAGRCGVAADTIRRLARELAHVAFEQEVRLAQPWTDAWGREHAEMVGRPVAMHAMRGISAHSNGFQTCRMLHALQLILGAVETPGSFRFQPPYPRGVPPANRPGRSRRADGSLDAAPLGYPRGPGDLLVDAEGRPRRIDHAFGWSYPLAVHGMLHTVIRNAWAGDPYRIDTLMLFMANMAWNSAMNTPDTIRWLTDRDETTGEYRIPRIIYSDAYSSEMVAYADLVLPDTTYLERHDCSSLLDRPISDADAAIDAIRQPVLAPDRDVRPFQDVLLDIGARLRLPGMARDDGSPRWPGGFAQYMVEHERTPGVGLLAGWRGREGDAAGRGEPNPAQLQRYIDNGCFWRHEVPERGRYFKMANRDYLQWAQGLGFVGTTAPIVMEFYSETLQRFRLAALGHGPQQPPDRDRERVARYFDPLPFWYEPFETAGTLGAGYPLHAVTQRPMFMYQAWGSQNRWLRQIATRNVLYVHPDTAAGAGLADGEWAWLESHHGRMRVPVQFNRAVEPGTVWTWNAIGKRRGAWGLAKDAPEGRRGFLLNHLVSDVLPGDAARANADPVTGQAAWYDLRVRLMRCEDQTGDDTAPAFPPLAVRGPAAGRGRGPDGQALTR
jgi:anaerobic selenocysteine-containing dehydrogenase